MAIEIMWLGHASIMVRTENTVLYIDPWKIGTDMPSADIILLTHDHYDHYSRDDVDILKTPRTRVVSPMPADVTTDPIMPGQSLALGDVIIEAIPAYNIDKEFHPKKNNWVGYVINILGKRVYHTGDTDHIPEMKGLKVDVALMPVGGTYTMTADDACRALEDIQADHAIPIHFGDIVGTGKDALRLSEIAPCSVHILSPGESFKLA
ncbi:MAG TPA: MBL fold metallo-hydrolase [Deltaproteobacteria bacterium]|mgnify:CR=1 FL=1|nr:MBL fold metallo-hydrolase [Deltaproteobacteria bacterium]